jgi:ribonucleoside-diphosphate reductase alpha chain
MTLVIDRTADSSDHSKQNSAPGLKIERRWTTKGQHPYDQVEWETRTASIASEGGKTVFEQHDVEVPISWSQLATNVVASKYFRGHIGEPNREHSVRQVIDRVADTITNWGGDDGYFASAEDAESFRDELKYLLLHQMMAFNSPVWFNLGVPSRKQQVSACFINSVEDSMESIMELAMTEAILFKGGSGSGVNLSRLRADGEKLSTSGTSSGPLSFMRGLDTFAGAIKSGGATRRAAKMVLLDVDHPDVVPFIDAKAHEEQKAWALIEAGYDGSYTGEAYQSVAFQNANHSVRVTDEFMRAVERDDDWVTTERTTGAPARTYKAREILRKMADAAWVCGDPGIQYDTTINDWHTAANTDRIYASNPCSEYVFLDDTACNLASLNLMKFVDFRGEFAVEAFKAAVALTITAQEIMVGNADYPTENIKGNSHKFRTLGLGYANLGALLMSRGLPYDSDAGRDYAAAITSIMSGVAYYQSAIIAGACGGPFSEYEINREPMARVMLKHYEASKHIGSGAMDYMRSAARVVWEEAILHADANRGYRNAQVSVLAPTGTISFLMDCDTTGVEPDIALVKYKKLVGEGFLKLVNGTVPAALARLRYSPEQIDDIVAYIDKNETIEGAPWITEDHLAIFDCAFKPVNGKRSIGYMGHIRMMAAVQPFVSGAISKTVNMPSAATAEEIEQVYIEGWKLGLKAIAVYRDGSKRSQPLNAGKDAPKAEPRETEELRVRIAELEAAVKDRSETRRRLPVERAALTHKFNISGHEGYVTVGLYEDGQPGEIFLTMAKEGSTISGLMDSFATAISLALQYGVPLKDLVGKFAHVRFEPAGFTGNPDVPIAKSIVDYLFRWMGTKFLPYDAAQSLGLPQSAPPSLVTLTATTTHTNGHNGNGATTATSTNGFTTIASTNQTGSVDAPQFTLASRFMATSYEQQADAPSCMECGSIMVRSGSCYKCVNCGATSGCS